MLEYFQKAYTATEEGAQTAGVQKVFEPLLFMLIVLLLKNSNLTTQLFFGSQ